MKALWLALQDECADFAGVALCSPGVVKTPLWEPLLTNKDWPLLPVVGARFAGGDWRTAEEAAEWYAALLDESQVNDEVFKTTEFNIDDPYHTFGIKVSPTS